MYPRRAQVKKKLPPFLLNYIKVLRLFYGRIERIYKFLIFPMKKISFSVSISIFPKKYWGYEQILDLIWQHRNYNLFKYSKLFLHYFQFYRELNPESILKWRIELCVIYLMQQETAKLERVMQDCIEIQESVAYQKKFDILGIKIINEDIFQNYNTHAYLDTHIKAKLLGWMPDYKIVHLIRPESLVANPTMLEYWKQYITIVEDEKAIEYMLPLKKYLGMDSCMVANLRSKSVYIEYAKGIVQKEWEKQKRPPLFKLNSDDVCFGRDLLAKKGIPKEAWFVCLHVRDAGYKTGSYQKKEEYDSYRNADIMAYEPAVREVIKRGGYVVRVGDPNMKPFIEMDGLFDYAHSDIRSNRMDIFLFSQCHFFIGVSSGPVLTPVLFGVPVVMTNFVPMVGRSHADNCIFIPKMIFLKQENRLASFQEVLSSNLGRIFSSHGYDKHDVELIDNSPDEIRNAIIEMIEILNGKKTYSEEDQIRQEKITTLYQKYSGYGDRGRMGNSFLQKYSELVSHEKSTYKVNL
jgi:putative glycosyltransferase (TIGR04372 family)